MGTMCCLAFLIFDQKQGTGEAKMYVLTVATSMPNSGAEGMCAGLTVVFDILCNPRSQADCEEKSEAAGLLAQITSPWLDPPMDDAQAGMCGTNGDLQPNPNGAWPTLHLTPYISSFIAALTELSSQTETEETLLLSTAALANLTFSHSEAVQLMTKYRTAQVLVQATSFRKELSVFIQDQIATILANMAAVYSARAELVSHGALVTLVSFLQLRPSPMQRPAEVTASERVLKKSAIALSRVCGEENAARQIVDLEGIERLAQLVRDPRERNYSDGVLVACLAALHKIATACGTEEVDRRGASDLIENRLLDVFLEYSSRPESYV
ncbi:Inscuteable [Daphnia magna]|uniref:Inscuteable n=1 Tax=Daphnia magna TaxID=35525 RepID=A0A164ZD52_9CRUS|nr:Inscuteable [Daphnia magna]